MQARPCTAKPVEQSGVQDSGIRTSWASSSCVTVIHDFMNTASWGYVSRSSKQRTKHIIYTMYIILYIYKISRIHHNMIFCILTLKVSGRFLEILECEVDISWFLWLLFNLSHGWAERGWPSLIPMCLMQLLNSNRWCYKLVAASCRNGD